MTAFGDRYRKTPASGGGQTTQGGSNSFASSYRKNAQGISQSGLEREKKKKLEEQQQAEKISRDEALMKQSDIQEMTPPQQTDIQPTPIQPKTVDQMDREQRVNSVVFKDQKNPKQEFIGPAPESREPMTRQQELSIDYKKASLWEKTKSIVSNTGLAFSGMMGGLGASIESKGKRMKAEDQKTQADLKSQGGETADIGAQRMGGDIEKVGKKISEFFDKNAKWYQEGVIPEYSSMRDEKGKLDKEKAKDPTAWAHQAGSAVGSMLPMVAAIGASGGSGAGVIAGGAIMGVAEKGDAAQTYTEELAKQKGVNPDDLSNEDIIKIDQMSDIYGALSAALESYAPSEIIGNIAVKKAGSTLLKRIIWETPLAMLKNGFKEGGTEWTQRFAQNVIAKVSEINPDQNIYEGAADEGIAGFAGGMLFGAGEGLAKGQPVNPNATFQETPEDGIPPIPPIDPTQPPVPQPPEETPKNSVDLFTALSGNEIEKATVLKDKLSVDELQKTLDILTKAETQTGDDIELKDSISQDKQFVQSAIDEKQTTVKTAIEQTLEKDDGEINDLSEADRKEAVNILNKLSATDHEIAPKTKELATKIEENNKTVDSLLSVVKESKNKLLAEKKSAATPVEKENIQKQIDILDERKFALREFQNKTDVSGILTLEAPTSPAEAPKPQKGIGIEKSVNPNTGANIYKIDGQEYSWKKPVAGDSNSGSIQKRNSEGILMARSGQMKSESSVLDFIKSDAQRTIQSKKKETTPRVKPVIKEKIKIDSTSEQQANLLTELDMSEAGKKWGVPTPDNNEPGYRNIQLSQESTFPKWMPEKLRKTKVVRPVFEHIMNDTIPTKADEVRLYNVVVDRLAVKQESDAFNKEKNTEINVDDLFNNLEKNNEKIPEKGGGEKKTSTDLFGKEVAGEKKEGTPKGESTIREGESNFYDRIKNPDKTLSVVRNEKDLLTSPLKVKYKKDGYFKFPNQKIYSPADIAFAFRELKNEAVEKFYVVGVKKGVPVSIESISVGSINVSLVDPFETVGMLLNKKADGAYLIHNHPSGEITPSEDDIRLTQRLSSGYKNLGIEFKGHVIIDTTKFGLIGKSFETSSSEQLTRVKKPVKFDAYKKYIEWITNKPTDFTVSKPSEAAEIAKGLNLDKTENSLLLFVDSRMKVLNAQFLPKEKLDVKTIAELGAAARSRTVFIMNHGMDFYSLKLLIEQMKDVNIEILDAISFSGKNGEDFVSARAEQSYIFDKQKNLFGEEVAKTEREKTQGQVILKPEMTATAPLSSEEFQAAETARIKAKQEGQGTLMESITEEQITKTLKNEEVDKLIQKVMAQTNPYIRAVLQLQVFEKIKSELGVDITGDYSRADFLIRLSKKNDKSGFIKALKHEIRHHAFSMMSGEQKNIIIGWYKGLSREKLLKIYGNEERLSYYEEKYKKSGNFAELMADETANQAMDRSEIHSGNKIFSFYRESVSRIAYIFSRIFGTDAGKFEVYNLYKDVFSQIGGEQFAASEGIVKQLVEGGAKPNTVMFSSAEAKEIEKSSPSIQEGKTDIQKKKSELYAKVFAENFPEDLADVLGDVAEKEDEAVAFSHKWSVKMPLEPETKETINKTNIVKWIEKTFNVPIKGKVTHKWKNSGMYYTKDWLVRLKKWGELPVIVHEVAHHIDLTELKKQYPEGWRKGSRAITKELADLDYDQKKRRTLEGFAEYLRYRMTTDEAKTKAPNFDKFFNEFLDKNLELKKNLEELKSKLDVWIKQGSENRIIQHIDWKGEHTDIGGVKDKLKNAWKFVREKFDDEFYVPQKITAEIERVIGRKLPPSKNPAKMMEYSKSKSGAIARTFVMDNAIDEYGNVVGKGLKEILSPVKRSEMQQFIAYAVSKRALDLENREKKVESGFDVEDAKFIVEKYKDKNWDSVSNELTEWSNNLLEWVVRAGGLDGEAAKRMREMNPTYLPFKRAFLDEVQVFKGAGGYVDTSTGIKSIKGSGRPIINPIESMIAQAATLISKAQKIKIANLFADLAQEKGLGGYITRVPAPMTATKFDSGQISDYINQLLGEENAIDNIGGDSLTVFSQGSRYTGKENVITVWRDGKIKFYEIHPELYNTFKAIDPLKLNPITKILAPFSRLLRLGATGLKISFGVARNPFRDALSYVVFSKRNKVTIFDPIKGIYTDLTTKKGEPTWRFKKLGGALSGQIGLDRSTTRNVYDDLLVENLGKKGKMLLIAKHPVSTLRDLISITEMGPRSVEMEENFKKYTSEEWKTKHPDWNDNDAFVQAFLDAQDVTVNFTKSGKWARQINEISAFFNVAIRGPEKMARSFKERPVASITKAVLWLTLTALLSWYRNKDEDWYKNLDPAYKYNNLFFEVGGNVIRLPVPFELGTVFMAVPQAVMDTYKNKDTEAMMGVLQLIQSQIPDPMISAFGPLWDVERNKNYLGIPIESEGMKYQYPTERVKDYTSSLAKALSKLTNSAGVEYSPVQIDYLIDSYTGGFLKQFKVSGGETYDLPVLSDLMLRDPLYPKKQINSFFSDYEKVGQKVNSDVATDEEIVQYEELKSFYATYKNYQAEIIITKANGSKDQVNNLYEALAEELGFYGYN